MSTTKTNVYEIITERVMDRLKAGVVPWRMPWVSDGVGPTNLVSGKAYRGVNAFILGAAGYPTQYWASYKQALALGGQVRKGEKGFPAVFWKMLKQESEGKQPGEVSSKDKLIPMLRYYTVFNVAQCDGIDPSKIPSIEKTIHDPIPEAERIVENMPKRPEIKTGGLACYSPLQDEVTMPDKGFFSKLEEFYSTLFHELTHATMHESRLNRRAKGESHKFGSQSYAREELVAEMGASFLCSECGILDRTFDNSAAYISNWLKKLSDDPKLVVIAAAQAQKASDFILGKFENREEETE
jgi:antirestriction protein ArdC